MFSARSLALLPLAVVLSASVGFAQSASRDWTQWRGPNRDGSATTLAVPKAWPEQLSMKWKVEVGIGYSTPIVVGNRVYQFSRRAENEVLAAFDADTGKELWQASYAAPYDLVKAAANHGMGPKSTPAFANGKVFTLGISGILSAFDANSGKLLWQKPAPTVGPTFGTSTSPLVDGNQLIVHVGGNNQGALSSFDMNTGDVKWHWDGDGPGYGSGVIATLAGARQLVTFTQQNIVGIDVSNGQLLWQRPFKTPPVVNSASPLIYGETVIMAGQEQGIHAFKVVKQGAQYATEDVWRNADLWYHLSNSVLIGDTIFGLSPQNRGQFFFLDAKTGKVLWNGEGRAADNAAIAKNGDLLLILEADGELVVAKSTPQTGLEPERRYKLSEAATWAAPSFSGNRVFVKDLTALALWTIN